MFHIRRRRTRGRRGRRLTPRPDRRLLERVQRRLRRRQRRPVRRHHRADQPHRPRRHHVRGLQEDVRGQVPRRQGQVRGLTDYEGEVKTRMNTNDYGDVLLLPNSVAIADLSSTSSSRSARPTSSPRSTASSTSRPPTARPTAWPRSATPTASSTTRTSSRRRASPRSPRRRRSSSTDLQAIKDKTDAVPLYTNYKDGWPLTWPQGLMGAYSGDKDALVKMAGRRRPWTEGKEKSRSTPCSTTSPRPA